MPEDVVLGSGILLEGLKLFANVTVVKLETSVVTVSVLAWMLAFEVCMELGITAVVGEACWSLGKVNVVMLESRVVTISVLASEPPLDVSARLDDVMVVAEAWRLLAKVNVVTLETQAVAVSVPAIGSAFDVCVTLVASDIVLGECAPLMAIVSVVMLNSIVVTVVVLAEELV